MLDGDMVEDERRPGMDKDECDMEVLDGALVVGGEKSFERERSDGRHRMPQCAQGSFRRIVPLPLPVPSRPRGGRQTPGFMENKTGGNIPPDLDGHKFPRVSDEKPFEPEGKTTCPRIRYLNLHCQVKMTSALLCATILRRQR